MKKFKNLSLYLIVVLIITVSFILPKWLLENDSYNAQIAVYKSESNKSNNEIEEKNIYLVKAIHDIEQENTIVEISQDTDKYSLVTTSLEPQFKEEILNLEKFGILNNNELNKNKKQLVSIITTNYQNDINKYTIADIYLEIENKKFELKQEVKTGKLIYINFPKELLNKNISENEIMMKYIEYLDLSMIDDWKFENNVLKSKKVELIVSLNENETICILSIHSKNNEYLNYYEINK